MIVSTGWGAGKRVKVPVVATHRAISCGPMTSDPPQQVPNPWGDTSTPYLALGGDAGVRRLATTFYATVGGFEVEEWLRCMGITLDRLEVEGRLRSFLDERFATVARHMQNQ